MFLRTEKTISLCIIDMKIMSSFIDIKLREICYQYVLDLRSYIFYSQAFLRELVFVDVSRHVAQLSRYFV